MRIERLASSRSCRTLYVKESSLDWVRIEVVEKETVFKRSLRDSGSENNRVADTELTILQ